MGDQLDPKEGDVKEPKASKSVETSKAAAVGDTIPTSNINGNSFYKLNARRSIFGPYDDVEPAADYFSGDDATVQGVDGISGANPDKPISTAEDNAPGMLPADPKDEGAVSGGAALGNDAPGLGSILKGSPFQQDKKSQSGTEKLPKEAAGSSHSSPSKSKPKSSINGHANGKPKELLNVKPKQQSKPKAAHPIAPARSDQVPMSKPARSSNPPISQSKAAAPPTNQTASDKPLGATSTDGAAENESQKKDAEDSQTPTDAATSANQFSPKAASPSQVKPREPRKEPTKEVKKPSGGPSATSKPPTQTHTKPGSASSSSTARPIKKPTPTSPKLASNKLRPKSPTRPARLPAAATAPTAASAAKLDGAPPSMSDRKPANFQSIRDRVPSNPSKSQSKPPRASLPASSKPAEKPKHAKPRQSMAGAKASEGSFLDRMMRPTQSSSQKTHDKVDPKSPPRKQQQQHFITKPKRISDGSDKSKSERPEAKPEAAIVSKESDDQSAGKLSDISNANTSRFLASSAAHTIPPTIPVP